MNTAVFGTIFSTLFFFTLFYKIQNAKYLLFWLVVMWVLSVLRFILLKMFLKRKNNDNMKNWGDTYIYMSFISSSLWGVAWFLGSNENDISSLAIVGMFAMGVSATPFSGYIICKKAILFFFLPIVTLVTLNYLYIGGTFGIIIAISFVIYTIVIISSSFTVNKSMTDAILIKYQLEDEINKRKKVEAKLLRLSIIDDLTGLYNRRYFDESLYSELQSSQRAGLVTSLILIDIDNFKNFNDNYGHINGDHCLAKVSQSIKSTLKRESDLTFRYGGEEIAVLLPNTKLDDAKIIAENIRVNVLNLGIEHKYSSVKDIDILTLSLGVASIKATKDCKNTDLIEIADRYLYKAKRNGKNKVVSS